MPVSCSRSAVAAAALLLAFTPASARDVRKGPLTISNAWTRPTPPGAPAAGGYLLVANRGRTADRLLSATSPAVDHVEVHEMKLDGGIMRMRPLPRGLSVPAGGSAELKPGGYHLMLIGPKRQFELGGRIPVTLRFERAGSVQLALDVRTSAPGTSR